MGFNLSNIYMYLLPYLHQRSNWAATSGLSLLSYNLPAEIPVEENELRFWENYNLINSGAIQYHI